MGNSDDIKHQYDTEAEDYAQKFADFNKVSIDDYFARIPEDLTDKKLLDLGCGDGSDLLEFVKRGATVAGVDSSKEMIKRAGEKVPDADLRQESFSDTSFESNSFDIVVSKWALQTHEGILAVYEEVDRLLKPEGKFTFLVTHPLRQFMEQKDDRNYFSDQLVTSRLFDGKVVVEEPNHALSEYFNSYFLKNFKINYFSEEIDAGAEVIDGAVYPSYFLVVAQKVAK